MDGQVSHWTRCIASHAIRLACVIAIGILTAAVARAVEISLSSQTVGLTPEIVGYNSGHFMPGSNTAAWWKYSGVNGARVWATPATVEGSDDNGVWGDGVTSQQRFLDRRAALRANPLDPAYNYWPHFEHRYADLPTT